MQCPRKGRKSGGDFHVKVLVINCDILLQFFWKCDLKGFFGHFLVRNSEFF